jgi:hypothetical protein
MHPYIRSGPESCNNADQYPGIRALATKYGYPSKPLFSSEWGYSSLWNPNNYPNLGNAVKPAVTEYVQSQYFQRQYLLNQMANVRGSVWYTNKDTDSLNVTFENDGFGIYRSDGTTRKPSYYALVAMQPVLSKEYSKDLSTTTNDYMPLFLDTGAGLDCIAPWTTGSPHRTTIPLPRSYFPVPTPVALPARLKSVSTVKSVANTRQANPLDITVTLSRTPQFISLNYS